MKYCDENKFIFVFLMIPLPPKATRTDTLLTYTTLFRSTPMQPNMLMYVNLYSTDKNADEKFLYNFASVNIISELQRLKGVGRTQILGSRSEEHTSELQSLMRISYAVYCLKKKIYTHNIHTKLNTDHYLYITTLSYY